MELFANVGARAARARGPTPHERTVAAVRTLRGNAQRSDSRAEGVVTGRPAKRRDENSLLLQRAGGVRATSML